MRWFNERPKSTQRNTHLVFLSSSDSEEDEIFPTTVILSKDNTEKQLREINISNENYSNEFPMKFLGTYSSTAEENVDSDSGHGTSSAPSTSLEPENEEEIDSDDSSTSGISDGEFQQMIAFLKEDLENNKLAEDESKKKLVKKVAKSTVNKVSKAKIRQTFPCPVAECNFITNSKTSSEAHTSKHRKDFADYLIKQSKEMLKCDKTRFLPLECTWPDCGEQFDVGGGTQTIARRKLLLHYNVHLGRIFECDMCNKVYATRELLRVHKLSHFKELKCDKCGMNFETFRLYEMHMHIEMKTYQCPAKDCGKCFGIKRELNEHIYRGCQTSSLVCRWEGCSETFLYKSDMLRHYSTHEGVKFECEICGKSYSTQYTLTQHKKTHVNNFYKCEDCGKEFVLYQQYLYHRNIELKKYECQENECGKLFRSQRDLDEHVLSRHRGAYECPDCRKKFSSARHLSIHMKNHTTEKFKCRYCGKEFTQYYRYRYHKNLEEKRYVCDRGRCEKFYGNLTHLNKHKRQHEAFEQFVAEEQEDMLE